MTAIFISHSSADSEAAARMRTWLKEQGHTSLFLDFDPDGIITGSDWEKTLYYQLRRCQAVLALLTPNWLASKWCFAELVQARERGKAIFPVKIVPCDTSGVFRDMQHLDLTDHSEEDYQRLAIALMERGLDPRDIFDLDPNRPPYPGLRAFQEADAAIYFGRGAEILNGLETLDALRRKGKSTPRFVLFLGASGSGKSSLVRAGLIPRLKKRPNEWLPVAPFRPQSDPLEELALSFADTFKGFGQPRDWGEIAETLRAAAEQDPPNGKALLALVRDLTITAEEREATVVLTIDQAEELFGYSTPQAATQFLRLLRTALEDSDRQLIVLTTMRSDFLSEFQTHPVLHDAAYDHDFAYQAVPVDPMPERNFNEIIQGPARLAGLRLEDGLVEEMVRDTGTRDALPLLAFTLRRLYERYGTDGLLEIREYDELGRLEGAIRSEAERVLNDAEPSPEELQALRAAFVPAMVRINADGGYARRHAYFEEIPDRAKELCQQFVDARLLVSGVDKDNRETLEVSHEALLRTWPQLSTWLAEDQDKLRLHESLHRAAEDWDKGSRVADLLVHREGRLHDVKTLVTNKRFALQEDSLEKHYLDACIETQRARELEEREEQERRVRDAERIAEEQRRVAQRTIAGLIVALILALGAFGAGWFAYTKQQEAQQQADAARKAERRAINEADRANAAREDAETQRKVAEQQSQIALSRQLAAQSTNYLNDQRDLALLLSLEAYRKADTVEGQASLLTGLQHENHLITFLNSQNRQFHSNHIRKLAFGPAGRILASASIYGEIRTWDVTAKKPLSAWTIIHAEGESIEFAFSPDGKLVVSAGQNGEIIFWDVESHRQLGVPLRLDGNTTGRFISLAFSRDGKLLATGSGEKVYFWDVKTHRQAGQPIILPRKTESAYSRPDIFGLTFSSDKKTLAVANGKIIYLVDMDSRDTVGKPLIGHEYKIYTLAFSADDRTLISSGEDGQVILWDVATYQRIDPPIIKRPARRSRIRDIAISPDGQMLAIASKQLLWDFKKQKLITEFTGYHSGVTAVAFSPNNKVLATGSFDGTIMLWDVNGDQSIGKDLNELRLPDIELAFSPDGKFVATAKGKIINLWSVLEGRGLERHLKTDGIIKEMRFNKDSSILATFTSNGIVKYWDLANPDYFEQIRLDKFPEKGEIAFSPDLNTLAFSVGKNIVIWEKMAGRTKTIQSGSIDIRSFDSFSFSPDGKLLAIGSYGPIALVDVATTRRRGHLLTGHSYTVRSTVFSPNGKILASANDDGTIRFWNVGTQKEFGIHIEAPSRPVMLAFSPNGKILASGSVDGSINLWDVSSRQSLGPALLGNRGEIGSLFFSDVGETLISANRDGSLLIWNLDPASWKKSACGVANRNLLFREWKQYIGDTPYQKTCRDLPRNPGDLTEMLGNLIDKGEIDQVVALFSEIQALELMIGRPIDLWNQICWQGSKQGHAKNVMPACERAVELAPDHGGVRDSRGLARALTGDYAGAIADFEYFVKWAPQNRRPQNAVKLREGWIRDLKKGSNPFDTETRKTLQ